MDRSRMLARIVDAGAPHNARSNLERVLGGLLGYTPDAGIWGGARESADAALIVALADTEHAARVLTAIDGWYRAECYHHALALLAGAPTTSYTRSRRRARDLRRAFRVRMTDRIVRMQREINLMNRALRRAC